MLKYYHHTISPGKSGCDWFHDSLKSYPWPKRKISNRHGFKISLLHPKKLNKTPVLVKLVTKKPLISILTNHFTCSCLLHIPTLLYSLNIPKTMAPIVGFLLSLWTV